ncbi:hypothetical protein PAHAL_9G099300 [Panicum hallii]|uniref:Uncharacterized protein n=1 Tax=Panicum hallii TaxID=206008 RepID=A0A2S3IIC5_9POAL|nr:hypothetical protein PAHAL_9G099300 [Panicum hallii]
MQAFILQFLDQLYPGGYISFFITELNKDTYRRRMTSFIQSNISSQLQKQVSLFTNPIWLVKTRLQLQTPKNHTSGYSGFSDALRTILKEEGFLALYRGIGPGLLLVTHGAIQFTAYEELRKAMISMKTTQTRTENRGGEESLNSIDFAALGAGSKVAAILLTYPYQVIRARLQQRPGSDGTPKYSNSWHVVKETAKYEGVRGFYRGITSNLLKNLPAASLTFVVYENVVKLFKAAKEKT